MSSSASDAVAVPAEVPEATLSDTPVIVWLLNVGAALSTTVIVTGNVAVSYTHLRAHET